MNEELIDFRGTLIYKDEAEALNDIERFVRYVLPTAEFEVLNTISPKTFMGVVVKDSRVVGLACHSTNLKRIPLTFHKLIHLEELYLSRNKLTKASEYLFYCTKLKRLDLSCNSIRVLPSLIGKLKDLQFLNLQNNLIKVLPGSLFTLRNLCEIYLKDHSYRIFVNDKDNLKDKELNIFIANLFKIIELHEPIGYIVKYSDYIALALIKQTIDDFDNINWTPVLLVGGKTMIYWDNNETFRNATIDEGIKDLERVKDVLDNWASSMYKLKIFPEKKERDFLLNLGLSGDKIALKRYYELFNLNVSDFPF